MILSDEAGSVPCIVALGAATSIGRGMWPAAAALRANLTGFAEHPFMVDTAGEPMRVALAPWLDVDLTGPARFEALLTPALDQSLVPVANRRISSLRVGLSLGLPAPRPGLKRNLESVLLKMLEAKYESVICDIATFPNGHAAGLMALADAVTKMASGAWEACIVAGVDSYMEPETLEWIEECDQFHGAGSLNNAWGFIPGEGSGALLLADRRTAARLDLAMLGRLHGVGIGFEPNRIKTDTVCLGQGLTHAFQTALATLPEGSVISDIYCDMNGEPYRADEYGFACLRSGQKLASASDFTAPADCWGDVSAATGPLCIGLSLAAGVKGYSKGRWALSWASSESGERAAAVLETRHSG